MNKFVIRDCTDSDADLAAVMDLVAQFAAAEKSHLTFQDPAQLRREMLLPGSPVHCWVVENSQAKIVGTAVFLDFFSMFAGRRGIYLLGLFIEEPFRSKGIGTQLLKKIAKYACDHDCHFVRWLVNENSPALALYRKLGAEIEPGWVGCRVKGAALELLAE